MAQKKTKGTKQVAATGAKLAVLKIEYVPTDSVKPNPYNPNRQNEEEFGMLRSSMREDGFTTPILVQRATNEIVDGEHRWRAARAEGLEEVPVVFTDMSPEQMRVATLRHNRAVGAEDVELGAQVLRDLRELGALDWAQQALALDQEELDKLLNDTSASEGMAAAEYSEGWTPEKNQNVSATSQGTVSHTEASAAQTVDFRTRLDAAQTPDERVAVEAERRQGTFRLSLIFSAADAALVRKMLMPKPAERLLALCLAHEAVEAEA